MKNCDFNQRYPLPSKLFRFLKNNLRVAHIKKTQMMSLTFFYGPSPASFSFIFSLFQTKITIFAAN